MPEKYAVLIIEQQFVNIIRNDKPVIIRRYEQSFEILLYEISIYIY